MSMSNAPIPMNPLAGPAGGRNRGTKPWLVAAALLGLLSCMAIEAERRRPVRRDAWSSGLQLERVSVANAALALDSSTRLRARWASASGHVAHYRLTAVDVAGDGVPYVFEVEAGSRSAELAGLASSTEWSVSIEACDQPSCLTSRTGGAASESTEVETWQVHGTGSGFANASKLVSDGNTKPFPMFRGADAGAGLEGSVQLYYDPNRREEKGIKIGTIPSPITGSIDSVARFEPLSGFGFLRGDVSAPDSVGPATHHPVALTEGFGGAVRMFWETALEDGRGRVFSNDSMDGWVGRDFHPGEATICTTDDVRAGGACEPELVVGVEADDPERWPRIGQARQLKLILPTLDDWRWDGSPGTAMIVTFHFAAGVCSSTMFNAGLALWDGVRWNVQYGEDGCPKLIPRVQAPMPVHLGGTRWKLVFNDNEGAGGPTSGIKPLKILYADARNTGDPALLEFEDFEPFERRREVRVLWPDGTELSIDDESRFDDYAIWMPTGDPGFQVVYSNMSCPEPACGGAFIGTAVLANP